MARTTSLMHTRLVDAKGKPLGTVDEVLFHGTEPRVVGLMVNRPRLFYVITRKPVFIPLVGLAKDDGGLRWHSARLPGRREVADAMGDPESTVVWRGMELATASGERLGVVKDVRFRLADGAVLGLTPTGGFVSDAALGSAELPGEHVLGFDGSLVRVADEAKSVRSSDGVVAKAGRGTAVAKVKAGRAATAAARGAGRMWGRLKRAAQDAMADDE